MANYRLRIGETGLPAWIPAAGTFVDVGTSTPNSVKPTGWPANDVGGPFSNWAGGVWCPDFGTQGGFAIHGSGHLTGGTPVWAGVWVWDVATETWVGRNVPSDPLLENPPGTGYNDYYESTITATAGHTYTPHTYDGTVFVPASAMGNSGGGLLRLAMPGSPNLYPRVAHLFDLDSATSPPTRINPDVESIANSYPASAADYARGGVWVTDNTGLGGVGFLNFATWTETRWASVAFNAYGDQSLIYIPERDCLVALGRDGSGGVNMSVRVCPIVSNAPTAWTTVTQSGTPPGLVDSSGLKCGGVWCSPLSAIVSYEAAGSYTVHKLTPPANLTAGTWAWSNETLTGASGAVPCRTTATDNGAWSRFIYAPEIGCFLWADSVAKVTQAWRLTGV